MKPVALAGLLLLSCAVAYAQTPTSTPASPLPALPEAKPASPAASPETELREALDGMIGSGRVVWLSTKKGTRRLGTFQGRGDGYFVFQHLHFIKGSYYPNGFLGGLVNYYYRDGDAVTAMIRPAMTPQDWTYDHAKETERIMLSEIVSVDVLDPPVVKSHMKEMPPAGTGGFSGGLPGWAIIFCPWTKARAWPVPTKASEDTKTEKPKGTPPHEQ